METVFFYNSTEASHNDDHWLPYCTIKSIFWKVSEKAIKVWLKRITVAKRQADNKKQNKYLCRFCCLCRLTENNGQHGCVCVVHWTHLWSCGGGWGGSLSTTVTVKQICVTGAWNADTTYAAVKMADKTFQFDCPFPKYLLARYISWYTRGYCPTGLLLEITGPHTAWQGPLSQAESD